MRSIFRDFTYDYFSILAYPKEKWHDFWLIYREKHPRVLEEYMHKNNLDDSSLSRELERLDRREIDRLSQYWQEAGPREKSRVLKELGTMSADLHLEREDFVIHILGGLGKQEHLIVPTSKGNVVMIDLLHCWKNGSINDFLAVVNRALEDFLDYSRIHVRNTMNPQQREERYTILHERLIKELDGLSFEHRMKRTVAFLDKYIEHYNWTGFYLSDGENYLVLGPYVGEPTEHTRIPFGRGICGQAAETRNVFLVPDVTKESNYLSCSPKTKSEIVLPLIKEERVIGELDIDSHFQNSFFDSDREFLEKTCQFLIGS